MYAEVLIEYKVKSLDRSFTYIVPDNLKDIIKVGMKVTVPFGQGDSVINGFVTKIKIESDLGNLKTIKEIVNVELVLNEELMKLGYYLRDTTLCTLISAYQTMLPSSLKIKNQTSNYQKYKTFLISKVPEELLKTLIVDLKGKNQIKLLEDLIKEKKILKSDYSSSTVKTLIDKGIIQEEKEEFYRINKDYKKEISSFQLTTEQQNCFDKIKNNLDTYKTYLIHGVTGSGKTEIYMRLIEEVVKKGKSAIMLVPEITLSMQIVDNFYKRFGNDVAILHSALSNGEKYDEYLKIQRGDAHIIVGTRSAIFSPVKNLGIIIIDEEHSESYKQDNTPRYNAIDIAKWRGEFNNVPVVLGSATPTFESFARAIKEVYTLLSLPHRVGNANLPDVKVIDMTLKDKRKNSLISSYLEDKIRENLEKGYQSILLLNRRGFNTLISCSSCGYAFKCPNCDITLTYHKSSNALRCHYCGYHIRKPNICPECKSEELKDTGMGTEQLEEILKSIFPMAKIIRMDADTTSKKGSHEKIIEAFKNLEYDILLGTQMISKGLDFPNVTLVGVISADAALNIPDFRSGERAFALLNQVAGRAGRSGLSSEVVIQTYNPDNFTIKMVEMGSYIKNYQYEMSIRSKLKYPPYYYLVGIKICSSVYENASEEANKIYKFIKDNLEKESIILGPTTAGIFKIKNIYRFQIVIKYKYDNKLINTLKELDKNYVNHKTVYLEIDMNPYYI